MPKKIVQANGVPLCVEPFGDPTAAAILLIHGAAAPMGGWEDEFCARLAAGPRFVIRYDHRDTGQSVSYAPGAPPYALRDLAADAIGILDALADPIFPLGHALALERGIPGARLLTLPRVGHELPPAVWDVVVPAILQHTSGSR